MKVERIAQSKPPFQPITIQLCVETEQEWEALESFCGWADSNAKSHLDSERDETFKHVHKEIVRDVLAEIYYKLREELE